MSIEFSLRHLREWEALNGLARSVTIEFLHEVRARGGPGNWYTTSIERTPEEDAAIGGSGIHCLRRAVDISSRPWAQAIADAAAAATNARWAYDPDRPEMVCVLTAEHGTGRHAHIQVSARTTRRAV